MEIIKIVEFLKIYTNGSNEVFIENTHNGVTIRVSDSYEGLKVSTTNNMNPTSINGLQGFRVNDK